MLARATSVHNPSSSASYAVAPASDTPWKTALFVDFDNIYLGLRELAPAAAERFATSPTRWLEWFAQGMPVPGDSFNQEARRRSVLIRRCYLNPKFGAHNRYHFMRAAFTVIDCPSLTFQGKNSADIQIVMDILDTLDHQTYFDEFIILSGDSDFTHVLLRLRAHNRSTTIVTVKLAVEPYKAAADMVITREQFMEAALGYPRQQSVLQLISSPAPTSTSSTEPPAVAVTTSASLTPQSEALTPSNASPIQTATPSNDTLRLQILAHVRQILAESADPILMAKVAAPIHAKYKEQIVATHWAGSGSFKRLIQHHASDLRIVTGPEQPAYLYDPSRHAMSARLLADSPLDNKLVEDQAHPE